MSLARVLTTNPSSATSGPSASGAGPAVPWERIERFVGQFTHDIRNGLNALELQLTFLSEVSTDPEAITEIRQLRSSLGEISRHLQAVKLKTGSVSAHAMEYPAGDFFEDLHERFERTHPVGVSQVLWKVEAGTATLFIDPELTINALLEILENGLYFGGEAVEITLEAVPVASGGIRVTLRQTLPATPGVPPEQWGHEPLLTTRRNTYGLGMFRTRRVLEKQGATLDALYTPDNVLTIVVVLPSPPASS